MNEHKALKMMDKMESILDHVWLQMKFEANPEIRERLEEIIQSLEKTEELVHGLVIAVEE